MNKANDSTENLPYHFTASFPAVPLTHVSPTVDRLGLKLLSRVLPDEEGATDVNVEGSYEALLRDLDAHVQHLDQFDRDAFPLAAATRRQRSRYSTNCIIMSTSSKRSQILDSRCKESIEKAKVTM